MTSAALRIRPLVVSSVLAACVASLVSATAVRADPQGTQVLFTEQDSVQAFDLVTGKGYQIGSATGLVSGTSFVDFQFAPSAVPSGDALPTFHQNVLITDVDGDQIRFEGDGTGTFHLGVPGFTFQGSGGPLQGTYTVTGGTGKFGKWKVGATFGYKAALTNPPTPPGGLGTSYAQVTTRGLGGQ